MHDFDNTDDNKLFDNRENAEKNAAENTCESANGCGDGGEDAEIKRGYNGESIPEGVVDAPDAPNVDGGDEYRENEDCSVDASDGEGVRDTGRGGGTQSVHLTPGLGVGKRKKKSPKPITRGVLAACMAGSLVLGMAGGVISTNVMLRNDSTLEPKVIYQAVETNFDGQSAKEGQSLSTEDIVALVSDSVVEISTEKTLTDFWFGQYVTQGAGSGVVISENGYIITNYHVISGASKITVRLTSGKEYDAKLVGYDEKTDIAVIKIDETGLSPAIYGDSDALRVGNHIVAIGNPLGRLGGTVTDGIISALDRDIMIDGKPMNLLQISAAINPGNSGGGLFDGKGQLVGIVNAKSAGSSIDGLAFAIPINDVKEVVENIMNVGYVPGRALLGVTLIDINDVRTAMSYRVQEYGAYILETYPGGAAARAGLEPGDYVVSIDGVEVSNGTQIKNIVETHVEGDTVKMVIKRGGETMSVDVTF
ncbi:MAG: trypsin-like peptidase domain-containing protein [Clostridia bacterium]|nr:trypsin-like peptidase domain-containing protein [Clostridia bacterium]